MRSLRKHADSYGALEILQKIDEILKSSLQATCFFHTSFAKNREIFCILWSYEKKSYIFLYIDYILRN